MERFLARSRTRWAAVIFIAVSSPCGAIDLPDWPRPPTEDDCRDFQTRINAIYDEADREYRACYHEPSRCGSAPGRRGAAAAKRATIPSCFFLAYQKSNAAQVGEFLSRDRDSSIKVLGDFVKRTDDVLNRVQELNDLGTKLRNYGRLSPAEKGTLHTDLAQKLNAKVNINPLSKELTSDALAHVAQINRSALVRLEMELDQIIREHAEHVHLGRQLPMAKLPAQSAQNTDLQNRIAKAKAASGRSGRNFETLRERLDRDVKSGGKILTTEEYDAAKRIRESNARAACANQRTQCFDSCNAGFSTDPIIRGVRQTNCRNSCTASSDLCEGLASGDPYNIALGRSQMQKADELNRQNMVEANRRIVERQRWEEEERRRRELYARQQRERMEANAAAEAFFSAFNQAISGYRAPVQYGGGSAPYMPPAGSATSRVPWTPAIREGRPVGVNSCPTIVCKK